METTSAATNVAPHVAEWVAQLTAPTTPRLTAIPYGNGLLIDLPWCYTDGDSIRVLVERHEDGYRVTDRATGTEVEEIAETGPETDLVVMMASVARRTQHAESIR